MPKQPKKLSDVLSKAENSALSALGQGPIHRRSPGKNGFWCVGCIIDTAPFKILKASNCFEAGDSAGSPVSWFYDFKGTNSYCVRDSEIMVLNQLDQEQKWNAGGGATSLLMVMFGEFGPCASCRAGVKHYRAYHKLPATVIYQQSFQASGIKKPAWPQGTDYGWKDAELTSDGISVKRLT